jgi:alkylated DNA repair dioxygenase AlkB
MHLQGSLFDQADELRLGPLDGISRTHLGFGAWLDVLPGWLSGSDVLFEQLAAEVPWRAERRTMYDHVVDVPRLLAFFGAEDALPHPVLTEARDALSAHYGEHARDGPAHQHPVPPARRAVSPNTPAPRAR